MRDGGTAQWLFGSARGHPRQLYSDLCFQECIRGVLCIICVQRRVFLLGSSGGTYGAVKGDRGGKHFVFVILLCAGVCACVCVWVCIFPTGICIWVQNKKKNKKTCLTGNTAWTNPNATSPPQTSLVRKWTIYALVIKKKVRGRSAVLHRTATKATTTTAQIPCRSNVVSLAL